MPIDMFLKIGDIEGESTDAKHKGELDVLSFSWNISRDQQGRAKVADFSIVKNVDKATPQLFDKVCGGDRISEATFTARKAGKGQQEFLIIKMSDILITNVSPAGNNTNDRPMEQFALSFSRSEVTFIPEGGGAPVTSTCSPGSDSAAANRER